MFGCATLTASAAQADTVTPYAGSYDGRPPEQRPLQEVLLGTTRGAIAPAYQVAEYGLRRPLGWLVTNAERAGWISAVVDFITQSNPNLPGVAPTALMEFGYRPAVGVYVFWNDVGFKGHEMRLHGATWGRDWLRLSIVDRYNLLGDKLQVGIRTAGARRGDRIYTGLGSRTLESNVRRYREELLDGNLFLRLRPWRSSELRLTVGLRRSDFSGSDCCDEPSITDQAAPQTPPLPPGFEGYDAYYERLEIAHDSRAVDASTGDGARVELQVEQGKYLREGQTGGWIRYGGSVGTFVDLTGHYRVLGLQVAVRFADPVAGAQQVPFTEQAHLGGDELMRGFLYGRLVDRSAAVARLEYRWPVWAEVDGSLHYAVGNVFGPHLEGIEAKLMRMSFGAGLRLRYEPDYSLHALIAFGSETFADGAAFDSVRVVLGATHGF